MNQRTIGAIALLLLLSGNAVAAVVSAGSGSYTDTLPAGKPGPQAPPINTTAAIKSPVPTNDWWTSLVASVTPYRLFAFPQCYRCDPNGLLVGYPTITKNANSVTTDDTFIQQLLVQGVYGANTVVTSTAALVDGYSDWTVTTLWKDQTDPSKYFRATFGHGLVFNYFEFANGVSPQIIFPLDWHLDGSFNVYDVSGNPIAPGTVFASDHKIVIEFVRSGSLTKRYFGVFAPAGASFALDNLTDGLCHQVRVTLPEKIIYPSDS
jgi:hypothetical protein